MTSTIKLNRLKNKASIPATGLLKTSANALTKFAIRFHKVTPVPIIVFAAPINRFPIKAYAVANAPQIKPVADTDVPAK